MFFCFVVVLRLLVLLSSATLQFLCVVESLEISCSVVVFILVCLLLSLLLPILDIDCLGAVVS